MTQNEILNKYSFLKSSGNVAEDNMMFGLDGIPETWYPLIDDIFSIIDSHKEGNDDFRVFSVKEKRGELRVDYMGGDEYISDILSHYTLLSCSICTKCGRYGKIRYDIPWFACLCNECYNDLYPNKKENDGKGIENKVVQGVHVNNVTEIFK